jgi:hypothetical protein
LTLLYQINTRETLGKTLSFTGCGTRIIELRDHESKIWEAAVLIRKASNEDLSISELVTLPAHVLGEGQEDIIPTTSACVHLTRDIIFLGKDDGTTNMYSALTGELQTILYSHKQDIFVRMFATSANNVVTSKDSSSTVMAYKFGERPGSAPTIKQLFNHRFNSPAQQFILSSTGNRLLVYIPTTDSLWSRTPENPQFTRNNILETPSRSIWR